MTTSEPKVILTAEDFGPFLQQRRRELGMRQADLAKKVGVMPHHISRLETGFSEPKISTLLALMDALNVRMVAVPIAETKPEYAATPSAIAG